MLLICQRCTHMWNYKGKSAWYASCPRCKTSIKVPKGGLSNVLRRL